MGATGSTENERERRRRNQNKHRNPELKQTRATNKHPHTVTKDDEKPPEDHATKTGKEPKMARGRPMYDPNRRIGPGPKPPPSTTMPRKKRNAIMIEKNSKEKSTNRTTNCNEPETI